MASAKKLFRSFFFLLLPTIVLLILAVFGSSMWLLHQVSNPPRKPYLVKPETYALLSARGAKVSNEKWQNADGSAALGWLLRGAENSPSVILLHKYGADRSYLLDLGVKINEVTNFTILMLEQRGHGESEIPWTSFGGCESQDINAAVQFLSGMKTETNSNQTNGVVGVYGVELGAYSGLVAAATNQSIKALVVDSVPMSSDQIIASAIKSRYPFLSDVTSQIAQLSTYPYFQSCYKHAPICAEANLLSNKKVLVLAGVDSPDQQSSSIEIGKCLPNQSGNEIKTDLSISGINLVNNSMEQADAYNQRIIEFFKKSLSN
jgi:hypothetical protein